MFSWLALERQVRFAGPVTKVTRAETEAYVATRPADSVVGSWASPQSAVVTSRAELDEQVAAARAADVHGAPRARRRSRGSPRFWGGYRLEPTSVEFWQGRPNRLHDRLRYRLDGDAWVVERLAP